MESVSSRQMGKLRQSGILSSEFSGRIAFGCDNDTFLNTGHKLVGWMLMLLRYLRVQDAPVIGLAELMRLDHLPRLKTSVKVAAVTSYDRTGGNDDGFSGSIRLSARRARRWFWPICKAPASSRVSGRPPRRTTRWSSISTAKRNRA